MHPPVFVDNELQQSPSTQNLPAPLTDLAAISPFGIDRTATFMPSTWQVKRHPAQAPALER
jgi:hypothetical protein